MNSIRQKKICDFIEERQIVTIKVDKWHEFVTKCDKKSA